MLHHLAPLLLLLVPAIAKAQTADLDELARHLEGDVQARLNGRMELVLDLREGVLRTQQYVIPLRALDPSAIDTTPDGRMLKLACSTAHPRCLSRELFHQNTRWRSSEMVLPLTPGAGASAVDLVRALLPDETAQCR
jgi:hypothetical protein